MTNVRDSVEYFSITIYYYYFLLQLYIYIYINICFSRILFSIVLLPKYKTVSLFGVRLCVLLYQKCNTAVCVCVMCAYCECV